MLNEMQNLAVEMDGHCLITACPGSGKTTVLVHRASRLLRSPQVRVLGVTFSSDAAQELGKRVSAALDNRSARQRFDCGTFHSLCKRQVERGNKRLKLVNASQQYSREMAREVAVY